VEPPEFNKVVQSPHIIERMSERRIDPNEANEALFHPERVRRGNRPGRFVAERDFEGYTIRVVYTVEEGTAVLITAIKMTRRRGSR
jgi:hypothetical protein